MKASGLIALRSVCWRMINQDKPFGQSMSARLLIPVLGAGQKLDQPTVTLVYCNGPIYTVQAASVGVIAHFIMPCRCPGLTRRLYFVGTLKGFGNLFKTPFGWMETD